MHKVQTGKGRHRCVTPFLEGVGRNNHSVAQLLVGLDIPSEFPLIEEGKSAVTVLIWRTSLKYKWLFPTKQKLDGVSEDDDFGTKKGKSSTPPIPRGKMSKGTHLKDGGG